MMKFVIDLAGRGQTEQSNLPGSPALTAGLKALPPRLRAPLRTLLEFYKMALLTTEPGDGYIGTTLSAQLWEDTYWALEHGVSLNPVLQELSGVVNRYGIERELIDALFENMELEQEIRSGAELQAYRLGSALYTTVTLMCLRVLTDGDQELYGRLKPYAVSLGIVFHKIDLLRRIDADELQSGPGDATPSEQGVLKPEARLAIQQQVWEKLSHAKKGISQLSLTTRFAAYVALTHYRKEIRDIKGANAEGRPAGDKRIWDMAKAAILILAYIAGGLMILFHSAFT
ncbi:squalene/phytoene synthase family protein [Taibaiella chishuiensis]|uniref:Phytoene/squalene synthetase n=1 Tax=Taibaiella chishuiensis TaxID=1434707 RepID=A0A2P8D8M7_9BACT|nr:squalene/phytoene synthase family protein [Taibaiella chishuiensis]PSK93574.1 phytoene/squalene synthetase [Taibaiella chishuiensis]